MDIKEGNVCRCRRGKIGVVLDIKSIEADEVDIPLYRGIGFDGKPWQSVAPLFLSENINEYLEECLV